MNEENMCYGCGLTDYEEGVMVPVRKCVSSEASPLTVVGYELSSFRDHKQKR